MLKNLLQNYLNKLLLHMKMYPLIYLQNIEK